MATTIDEIQVLLSAKTEDFERKLANVQKQLGSLEKNNAKMAKNMSGASKNMTAGMVALGGVISGVVNRSFQALSSQAGSAIQRLDTLNNFPKIMSNLGISTQESEKAVSYLAEKLKGVPTSLDTATQSVQRLTAVNKNLGASTHMFLAMNNAIMAGGASTEIQKSAIEQLSQAYSKGKPDIMEWRTMLMAMPAQLDQVAKAMNFGNATQLQEALAGGKVSMNEFMLKLVELNKTGFAGFPSFEEQARNASGGVQTSLINLQNAFTRAMAEIMNAVGQTNISGFFNGIARMIDAIVPYIVGFVKVVVWAFGLLGALFGKKSGGGNAEKLNKSLQSAGAGAGGVASGAEQADKALGGANKKAKKLAQQLASFDEMNVLKEQDTADGGGGGKGSGGGGAGGMNLGALELPELDGAGAIDKATEIAEKIKKALTEAFADFNFEAVRDAFIRLWDDIGAGLAPVGRIISDVWTNYLFPFLKWSGDTLLPAVLNAVGGAIRLLGAIIGEAWARFLKPFIDEFLVPIAKWTGGVAVSTLNNIGNSLRDLSKNEQAVRGITSALMTLGTAFGALKIGAIIAGWLPAIQNGIVAIGAWKGGFVSLGTALQGVGGIFTPIGTMLGKFTAILGGVKGAFSALGAVIMGHPIVALVSVIAGLLLTNEQFRNSLWNMIQTALAPFGDAISAIIEAVKPLGETFTLVADIAMNLLGTAFNFIAGVITILAQVLSPVVEAFGHLLNFVFTPISAVIQIVAGAFGILIQAVNAILAPVSAFTGGLKDASAKTGELGTIVGQIFAKIMEIIRPVAEWVYGTLIKPIVDFITKAFEIIWGVISKVIEIFNKIAEIVLTVVIVALKGLWQGIQTIFAPVVGFFRGIWDGVVGIFRGVTEFFRGVFTGAFNAIKGVFNGFVGFFQGLWGTLVGIFQGIATAIGNTVGGVFKGVVNGIIGFVENFVNVPVRAINGLIDVINAVPGVSIGKLSPLRLPRLAKGGIVDHATMAIIGEAGKEAVMPLENNTGWITDLAGKIVERGGVSEQTATSQPIEVVINIGEDQIARKIIDNINDLSAMSGRAMISF